MKMPDSIEMEDSDMGGRFRVNRVDSRVIHRDTGPLVDEDTHSGNNSHQSTYYGTQYLKSLRYLTREVLPKEEYYREDFENAYRPALDDLHVATSYDKNKTGDANADAEPVKKGKVIKFGWIQGVYMRCLLNIWGVMLFLRLSWVVGQAGIGLGIVIILLANTVTIITTLSMSAVSTNGQIKGGGIYYMISRSLGPEFGAAIGLMFTLSNSIAVAMYIVGFCESLNDLLRTFGLQIVDSGLNDIRIVGSGTLVLLLIIAFVGMDWVTRTQMFLLLILILSQIDFVIGYFIGPTSDDERAKGFFGIDGDVMARNLYPDFREEEGVQHNFFSVFSVFFPAVTGIVAGANLSGDLKDPSTAIPKGTLLAIATTLLTYLVYPLMLGSSVLRDASGNVTQYDPNEWDAISVCVNATGGCQYGLQNNAQVMELVSAWGPLIYGGCFAATLSSAIASLVGAPRVLQALAKDKLYPFLGFFGKGYGANNDPVRGYLLCFVIAFLCVMIGELNAIAPLTSNFFLAAYTLINFSCFHASLTKSPGWRPAFKLYSSWVSLLGCLLCISVMFLSDWTTALVTFVVTISLYLYVSYRKPDVNWGSSTQAQTYVSALRSCHDLSLTEDHVKNYRPQVLVMSGFPGSRPALIDFANLITKNLSLLVCGEIIKTNLGQRSRNALNAQAGQWLKRHKIRGFYSFFQDNDFEHGTRALLQLCGMGKLRPNMILLGFKSDWKSCPKEELKSYFDVIHEAFDMYMAVGILRLPEQLDYSGVLDDAGGFQSVLPTIDEKVSKSPSETQSLLSSDKANDNKTEDEEAYDSPSSSPEVSKKSTLSPESLKKKKRGRKSSFSHFYTGRGGKPLSKDIINNLTRFRRKQNKGFIDVWWLYDDGGLTLLLPYIMQARSVYSGCKLRIFSLANKKEALDMEQKNLAALLSKFRIDYSDVVVIPDVTKRAKDSSREEFDNLIKQFRQDTVDDDDKENRLVITEAELLALKEKNNRHIRLRELLLEHSKDSTLVVMTLPMPRKGTVSAYLYMSWLETLTKDMPPILLVRGNQTSVLTFYS